jgi:hypothetical protein
MGVAGSSSTFTEASVAALLNARGDLVVIADMFAINCDSQACSLTCCAALKGCSIGRGDGRRNRSPGCFGGSIDRDGVL